jgi:hypothetical protein
MSSSGRSSTCMSPSRLCTPGAAGAPTVRYIDNHDWIGLVGLVPASETRLTARSLPAGVGGTNEVRAGSATGTLVGSAAGPVTGGREPFQSVSNSLSGGGSGALYLVFEGGAGALFDVDGVEVGDACRTVGTPGGCLDRSGAGAAGETLTIIRDCLGGGTSQNWTLP